MKLTNCILTTTPILAFYLTLFTFAISLSTTILQVEVVIAQLPQDTFFASGVVSSMIPVTNTETQSQSRLILPQTAITSFESAAAPAYNVSGSWVMGVSDGDLANFQVNLTVYREDSDGSENTAINENDKKYFEISNFRDYRDRYIQLQPSGVVFISGTTSIKSGNNTGASSSNPVETTIILDKYYRFQIILDSSSLHPIFREQPIQGYTTNFINSMGNRVIGSETGSPMTTTSDSSTQPDNVESSPRITNVNPSPPSLPLQQSLPSAPPSSSTTDTSSLSKSVTPLPPTPGNTAQSQTPQTTTPSPSLPQTQQPPSTLTPSPSPNSAPSPITDQPHPID